MRLASIAACLFALAGCGRSVRVIDIAAHRQPCNEGVVEDLCLLSVSGDRLVFTAFIEGFTHRWGHAYTVEVEYEPEPEPIPEDHPGGQTRLIRVMKDELVADGTEFSLGIFPGGQPPFLEVVGATRGRFMDGQEFSCATEALCTELGALLARDEHRAQLTFTFAVGATVEPVLHAIVER